MAIDPAFSSSKFAILVGEWLRKERMINIVYASELDRPSYEEAIDTIWRLTKQLGNIVNIGVDASNPELIVSLKNKLGESSKWEYIHDKIQHCKKNNLNLAHYMTVVPIVFNTENINFMASHSKKLLDDSRGLIAINEKFEKLITALKGAIFNEYKLDKEESVHNDLIDTFLMLCSFFKFKNYSDY
ncbi:MAG TPA: hypothetical protein VJ697_10985 [Nitrososphaeraceae archaeon]|nr:hypothetical protein [Nitrososphaeraceae archaeon]